MSFFDELDAVSLEKYDRQYSDRELIKRIVPYFRAQIKRIIMIGVLVSLISILGSLLPIVVSKGVDLIKTNPTSLNIGLIASAVIGIGLLMWAINWGNRRLVTRTVAWVTLRLASEAFQSAINHDLSFHDEYASGKIVSRITSDTRDFGQLVILVTDIASQVLEAAILGVVLVQIEWKLSLYVFALIPIVAIFAYNFRRIARRVTKEGMQAISNVNSTIRETISGIAIAKNFRQENNIYQEFERANTQSYRLNVRRGLVLSIVFPILNMLAGLATAILVYTGGLSVTQGAVTAGAWYLFLLSMDRFMYPVMNLSSFWTQIQNGFSAAERVFALIDAREAVIQNDNAPCSSLKGEVEFQHVNFWYKNEEPVLNDFNLIIKPGENVALVGHTGAGKSSIAKLVARFYEFQSGSILIDGMDIRTLNLESYRKRLGIVSQSPFLFSGTVADNIRYSVGDISDHEIEKTARQIGNGEWLDTLAKGIQTEVGERGSFLSMGQRQLVSLMRVLVQQPSIFILDEATASVDPFTEWQIQQGLKLILSKTTSFLIAHRLSTVRSVDRIIVLEKGNIIEEGSHEDLLKKGGHYAELYNVYFRHQSLAYVENSRNLAYEKV